MTSQFSDEWRACQGRVDSLEKDYATLMLLYCRGEGPAPGGGIKARLEAMRAEATDLLCRALDDLDARSAEIDATLRGVEDRSAARR